MKRNKTSNKRTLSKAVRVSSRIEGLSLQKAKNNKAIIQQLKKYGRAFSISVRITSVVYIFYLEIIHLIT